MIYRLHFVAMVEVLRYVSRNGGDIIGNWLDGFKDATTRARIAARLTRLTAGNFGDCKPVGGGVLELKISFGPGYRVYFAKVGKSRVLLLCGGDKRTQSDDIRIARDYLRDYKRRADS